MLPSLDGPWGDIQEKSEDMLAHFQLFLSQIGYLLAGQSARRTWESYLMASELFALFERVNDLFQGPADVFKM
ncbi:MAG: hypothetical protein A2Z25_24645 [Planctomycetes bacterium RBG_16_55_9]|nr:MAG: hypothetical protein A2Z25_24645 [Planctomycetes bacterium RBG_16_55_9]